MRNIVLDMRFRHLEYHTYPTERGRVSYYLYPWVPIDIPSSTRGKVRVSKSIHEKVLYGYNKEVRMEDHHAFEQFLIQSLEKFLRMQAQESDGLIINGSIDAWRKLD